MYISRHRMVSVGPVPWQAVNYLCIMIISHILNVWYARVLSWLSWHEHHPPDRPLTSRCSERRGLNVDLIRGEVCTRSLKLACAELRSTRHLRPQLPLSAARTVCVAIFRLSRLGSNIWMPRALRGAPTRSVIGRALAPACVLRVSFTRTHKSAAAPVASAHSVRASEAPPKHTMRTVCMAILRGTRTVGRPSVL